MPPVAQPLRPSEPGAQHGREPTIRCICKRKQEHAADWHYHEVIDESGVGDVDECCRHNRTSNCNRKPPCEQPQARAELKSHLGADSMIPPHEMRPLCEAAVRRSHRRADQGFWSSRAPSDRSASGSRHRATSRRSDSILPTAALLIDRL